MHSKRTEPKVLRVGAAQMKFAPTIDGNLAQIQAVLRRASARADAVLFPECALTSYTCDFAKLTASRLLTGLRQVGELAQRFNVNVLMGSPVKVGPRLYNCLVAFDRAGRATYCYAKCQLTDHDRRWFAPGNAVALFAIDDVPVTAVICHERRYPELVRLATMAGAKILFHPNAGLDDLAVSKAKRGGRDGVVARAFENAIYYVFANSVGPQDEGKWSAGDSKIIGPDEKVLALADNRRPMLITADLDLSKATGSYAARSMTSPKFLSASWRRMVRDVKDQARRQSVNLLKAIGN